MFIVADLVPLNKWQTSWNNSAGNKLYDIKPNVGPSQPIARNIRLSCTGTSSIGPHVINRNALDAIILLQYAIYYLNGWINNFYHVDTIKQLCNDVPIDNIF